MSEKLYATLRQELVVAMKQKQSEKLATLRLLLAAIKQHELDSKQLPSDEVIYAIINKMIKQRRQTILQCQQTNHLELLAKEEGEIKMLQAYLPAELSIEELTQLAKEAMVACQASSMRDMSNILNYIKEKAAMPVDLAKIHSLVKDLLAAS